MTTFSREFASERAWDSEIIKRGDIRAVRLNGFPIPAVVREYSAEALPPWRLTSVCCQRSETAARSSGRMTDSGRPDGGLILLALGST